MVRKSFLAGFFLCLLMVGCAHFAYKYYGLDGVSYKDGNLLGPSAAQDLPFSDCSPTDAVPHPCVIMFTAEFMSMKQDFIDTQNKLAACQQGK